MQVTQCLNKFLGYCKHCSYDVDTSHHPNNFDCPKFKPMGCVYITLEQPKENDERSKGDESD